MLRLGARGAYCMDQELQKYNVHSVPASKEKGAASEGDRRMVIVLRHGTKTMGGGGQWHQGRQHRAHASHP
jgi:hypothetical protein